MTTYTNPFTGQTISPSSVGYESITIAANTTLEWPINGNNTSVVANIIEITASTAGLKLFMPPATQVSTGQSTLIRNIGSNTFIVVDTSGNTIVSIASGIAEYIYVTDNATINGTWETVTFGAGTSSANAATLAGYGLTAIGTTLNQTYVESSIFSNTTLNSTYRSQFLVWATGVGTITLPTASAVGNGWFVMIRNGGTGVLTLSPSGSDTIDSNSLQQLQLTESLVIVSNGVDGWNTFAYGRSNVFAYTQLSKNITTGTYTLTAIEYANVVQEYFGTLTGNVTVVLPSTVQIYYLNNQTSGSFTLTFKTASVGAATVIIPQGKTLTVVCDGTNVFNSSSAAASAISNLTLNAGTPVNPSLNFSASINTGIYQPATNQVAISTNGVNNTTFTTTGVAVAGILNAIGGIGGGLF